MKKPPDITYCTTADLPIQATHCAARTIKKISPEECSQWRQTLCDLIVALGELQYAFGAWYWIVMKDPNHPDRHELEGAMLARLQDVRHILNALSGEERELLASTRMACEGYLNQFCAVIESEEVQHA